MPGACQRWSAKARPPIMENWRILLPSEMMSEETILSLIFGVEAPDMRSHFIQGLKNIPKTHEKTQKTCDLLCGPQPCWRSAEKAVVAGRCHSVLQWPGTESHFDVYETGSICWVLFYPLVKSGCATRLAKSKQPLSHSSHSPRVAGPATQPLSHSPRAAGPATQPLSHSSRAAGPVTQPLSHSEWLSGWVAGPATLTRASEWLSGWVAVAEWLAATQPLSQSVWVAGWVAGPATLTRASARVAAPATLPLWQNVSVGEQLVQLSQWRHEAVLPRPNFS